MQRNTSYEIGKGKPPKGKPFEPGQSGNPGGKTSAQRKQEIANAERATRIRGKFLEALENLISATDGDQTVIEERLTSEALRLIKEAEDRGLGTAVQSIKHGNDPDNPMPSTILIRAADDNSDH